MRISQLAERSGVPATTLRYYESAGLLHADRTPSGYRLYGEDAAERLAFIGAAKALGLPLDEIGELLTVWEHGACRDVKTDLRPRIADRLAEAERRVAELKTFAHSLRTALQHLEALPDRAGPCDPQCGFLAESSPAGQPVDITLAPNRQAAEQEAEQWRSAPVACSLTGDGMGARVDQWHDVLDGAVRTEIPDGLRLSLPADRISTVSQLAFAEQQCCSFFDFRLHLDGTRLHLEVRTAPQGADFLADIFGPAA